VQIVTANFIILIFYSLTFCPTRDASQYLNYAYSKHNEADKPYYPAENVVVMLVLDVVQQLFRGINVRSPKAKALREPFDEGMEFLVGVHKLFDIQPAEKPVSHVNQIAIALIGANKLLLRGTGCSIASRGASSG
jgi:hypothetical protein